MPVSAYTDLYDYETTIEDAFDTYLTTKSLSCMTQRSTGNLSTPRVAIQVSNIISQEKFVDDGSGHLRNAFWTATLKLEVITRRGKNNASHGSYRAKVRNAIAEIGATTFSAILLYHELVDIVEAGSSPTVNPAEDIDSTTLNYVLKFAVRADAWPAPVAPAEGGNGDPPAGEEPAP